MSGQFNPNGFSTTQVQKLVSQTCQGALTGFSAQVLETGLTGFAATCAAWIDDAARVEYQRSTGSNVVIEITGVNNGNLTYNAIKTTL